MKNYNLYWGEIHTHSTLGDGHGEPKKLLEQAKVKLDFFSLLDHSQLPDAPHIKVLPGGYKMEYLDEAAEGYWYLIEHWEEYCRLVNSYYRPGKLVTFIGQEWTSWKYGHWNVYFPSEEADLILAKTLDELVDKVSRQNAIVIPHHPAYQPGVGINWERVKPSKAIPLVEIYSYHGSSENDYGPYPMDKARMGPRVEKGSIESMLKLGRKLGFIASTDGHGYVAARYGLGITGVYAESLGRASIWEALLSKRTIATTGDRIKIYFSLNDYPLGSEIESSPKAALFYEVEAEDLIDKIELIKNAQVISRQFAEVDEEAKRKSNRFKFRLSVGWNTPGEKMRCKIKVQLKKGEILSVSPCIQNAEDFNIEEFSKDRYSFALTQEGIPPDSLVFDVRAEIDSEIVITANNKRKSICLKDLLSDSYAFDVERIYHTTVKIHRAWCKDEFNLKKSIVDNTPRPGDYYYVRVTQTNGQMAWSSPIWVR